MEQSKPDQQEEGLGRGEEEAQSSPPPPILRQRFKEDDVQDDNDDNNNNNKNAVILQDKEKSTRFLVDDHIARPDETHNFFTRWISALRRQRTFLFCSIILVVGWSSFCAYAADVLAEEAAKDPDGRADHWLIWLEGAGSKFRMIGILFVFAVVFRFNRCYDRWNTGRSFACDRRVCPKRTMDSIT